MNRLRILCVVGLLGASEGVERATGGAPTAFRIWHAGANATDHGTHVFSADSAKRLMAEQAARGNLYSIDADHLSLNDQAPPESRKAVGWHRLEVRDSKTGPELWAVDVQWTEAVRAGLQKDPPEWRYFSPAYDVSKESGEIVAYLNTALTNNPATWSVTALASRTTKGTAMKYTDILAALMGQDEEKKAAAVATLAAAFPDKGDGEGEGDKDKPKPKEEKKASEEEGKEKAESKKAAEDPPKHDEEKKAAIAATKDLAAQNAALTQRVTALEADKLAQERAEILASRKDLGPELVKTLEKMPIGLMKETIAAIPVPKVDPAAADRVTATRGAGRDGEGGEASDTIRAARLPQEEHEELAERFGRPSRPQTVHWERNTLVLPQITPEQARAVLAKRGGAPPPRRPMLAPPVAEIVKEVAK